MDAETRTMVRERARGRCEYCTIPDTAYQLPFHVEHIVASVHTPNDDPSNLAWACPRCNAYKGPNLATVDPATGKQTPLFNPRVDNWFDHFVDENGVIVPKSDVGRGAVRLLRMNQPGRLALRRAIIG